IRLNASLLFGVGFSLVIIASAPTSSPTARVAFSNASRLQLSYPFRNSSPWHPNPVASPGEIIVPLHHCPLLAIGSINPLIKGWWPISDMDWTRGWFGLDERVIRIGQEGDLDWTRG